MHAARPRLNASLWLFAWLLILECQASARTPFAALQPTRLRCEYQFAPIAVESPQPRLAWELQSPRRNERQTAYQIAVASSRANLRAGRFDLWDSGRVASPESLQIAYAGRPLASRQECHWQVRVWDADGRVSGWSVPTLWRMALLDPSDWQGRWIAATRDLHYARTRTVAGYHAIESKTTDAIRWVQVDLGAEAALDSIILHPAAPNGYEHHPGFGFPLRFRVEASCDPEFTSPAILADHTASDFANPGNQPVTFPARGTQARYIRVTATRLWNRGTGDAPYCFALAELEAFSNGTNLALQKPVTAQDSIEDYGWNRAQLTDGRMLPAGPSPDPDGPGNAAILLRREFEVQRAVSRATAYLCGLGYAELEVNGHKISNHVLDPGFTDYSRTALYVTHDITANLRQGANAVGVRLGGGWFNLATPDLFGFEKAPWSASPRMLCQVHIEYTDGTSDIIVSDPSWKWSTGEITFNCVRGGESIDARKAKPGWSQVRYDDADWQPAIPVEGPKGRLTAQQHPPIRATASIRPVRVTEPKPGVYVFDLGVNIAGWPVLSTRGPAGTRVTLQCNELLNADGTVNMQHASSHTRGRFQTDEFILKGRGLEHFEPRFTYHGFRYVQVSGLAEKPTLHSLAGRWVTTDPEPVGAFECSDPRLNAVQQLIRTTFLNNLHGIPTDCPQREKMGWMNDGCVDMEMGFYNFDSPLVYTKWFQDMMDAQDDNGHVPDFVPTCGWGRTKPDGAPGEMADPWWGGAIVLAPWKLYQHYGDLRVLEDGFPAMKAYVDYLKGTAREDVVDWGLGDWLDESAGGGGRRVPVAQTSTAAYAYQARIVGDVAALLGHEADAQHYHELAARITGAFNRKFLDSSSGSYAADSQTAQALPIALNLVPASQRTEVLARLVEYITGKRGGHVSAGIVGTLYLFKALQSVGRDDLALRMVTQEDAPGWVNMILNGGTSIWEAWDGGGSRNHPTFGCMGFWFYEGLAGIRPDPQAPGFHHFIIQPAVAGDLRWVRAAHRTGHGWIQSRWRRQGNVVRMEIAIPAGTSATVHVPTDSPGTVKESGRDAGRSTGVKFLRSETGAAVYEVGSGRYVFEALLPPTKG